MEAKVGGYFFGRSVKVLPANTPALFNVTIYHRQSSWIREAGFPTD